jgi:hypothetical protein
MVLGRAALRTDRNLQVSDRGTSHGHIAAQLRTRAHSAVNCLGDQD